MATLTFDKLAYVDRLQAAGVGEREARALAEGLDQALREEVATKTDLVEVKTGLSADIAAVRMELSAAIAVVRADLSAEVATVRADLSAEIAAVRADLSAEIAAVKADMSAEIATVKHDMLRWMVGIACAQVGLTVALIRLLPH